MTKKYELTDETKKIKGHVLHKIRALRDFAYVNEGETGGWVESEDNLSQKGECWVTDEACVYGQARIVDDAQIFGHALICGSAFIAGRTHVRDYAVIKDHAFIEGTGTRITNHATVCGHAKIYNRVTVDGYAVVRGHATLWKYAWISGNAEITDDASAEGSAHISGHAVVKGNAHVSDHAEILGDAVLERLGDYIYMRNAWSSGRGITYTRSNGLYVVGCFIGTGKKLIKRAYEEGKKKGDCYKAVVKYVESIVKALDKYKEE